MTGILSVIKEAATSKKFIVAVAGLVIVTAGKYGLELEQSTVQNVVYVVASFLIGQGIADHGKEAAKVQAVAEVSRGMASADEAIKAVQNT